MSDGDFFEFSIAHDRRYSLDHLWLKVLDEKKEEDMTVKIGISEFIRADHGDIVRVVLAKPEDDSEFKTDNDEEVVVDDDAETTTLTSGDELGVDDLMITVRTATERLLINAPFPCKIVELNGDVEDSPDLVNDDAYGDGWCLIVKPHEFDNDMYLDLNEYIEYLNEL
jgi:glycine cleavage system H protein